MSPRFDHELLTQRLLLADPEFVFQWLQEQSRPSSLCPAIAPQARSLIEQALLSRNVPLIDLGLAQHAFNPEVARTLFTEPRAMRSPTLRLAVLANRNCGSVPSALGLRGSEIVSQTTNEELAALLQNPRIDCRLLTELLTHSGSFTTVTRSDWTRLVSICAENSLFEITYGDKEKIRDGGSSELVQLTRVVEVFDVFKAAWRMTLDAPLEEGWATLLVRLLSRDRTMYFSRMISQFWMSSAEAATALRRWEQPDLVGQFPLNPFGELRRLLVAAFPQDDRRALTATQDLAIWRGYFRYGHFNTAQELFNALAQAGELPINFSTDIHGRFAARVNYATRFWMRGVYLIDAMNNPSIWGAESVLDCLLTEVHKHDNSEELRGYRDLEHLFHPPLVEVMEDQERHMNQTRWGITRQQLANYRARQQNEQNAIALSSTFKDIAEEAAVRYQQQKCTRWAPLVGLAIQSLLKIALFAVALVMARTSGLSTIVTILVALLYLRLESFQLEQGKQLRQWHLEALGKLNALLVYSGFVDASQKEGLTEHAVSVFDNTHHFHAVEWIISIYRFAVFSELIIAALVSVMT